jgi:hypothetical protein
MQERVGNAMELISIENNFLSSTPMAQQVRESIDKWDYMKLRSFTAKEIISTLKRLPTMGEKFYQLYIRQRVNNQNIQGTQKLNS